MSSVTMAADSTQADIIHHRVRPVVKAAASVQSGFRRGRQHVHRRDLSHSRRRSSSSRSHKQKRQSREHQVKKGRRRYDGSRSLSHDDTSDRDSDLDLSKDLLPISGYVRIKDEMVDHMFRSISNRKLRAMLPEILRPLGSDELKKLCVEQLEVMSKKRICRILDGADPETISSSGTEEEEDDDEEGSSGSSTDAEDGGPEVGSASADNEAVGSTSLHAADELPVKNSSVTSHLENEYDDEYLGDRNDNSAINSSENKEVAAAVDNAEKDMEERDGGVRDGKMAEEGQKAATVTDNASVINRRGLDGDEIFGITVKVNEARFRVEDPETSADFGGGCCQEESTRMNKRNIERSYRAKQLDDDERENDSDGGGVREKNLMGDAGLGVGTSRSRTKKDEEDLSDSDSIPSSLPHLDSEPEETCCPFVLLDTKFSQELKKSVEVENLRKTDVMTGNEESKEASIDVFVNEFSLRSGEISSLDQSVCADGARMTLAGNETREEKEPDEEHGQDVSELESKDSSQKKSLPPRLQTLVSVVESVHDAEEMVIEIQEHEFSDDVGDDGDVSYEREGENEGKRESAESSATGNKVSTKVHQEATGSDEQLKYDETKSIDDERSALAEKLGTENSRGLPLEEDKTLILGTKSKASEIRNRGLKRRSVEIADERLHSKMQKHGGKTTPGECRSEERFDSNSEQKKCVLLRNTGPADGKTALASKTDLSPETKLSSLPSFETCHRSENEGTARNSALQPTVKRETSLPPGTAEEHLSKSPSKFSQASSIEEMTNRKVIVGANKGLADAASSSSARVKGERPDVQISSSRVESSQSVDGTGRPTTSKTPHRTPSQQKMSTAEHASPSEAGSREPSMPVLSKTQLEILELEMRARAIKAMLKAQEELEKREEKLKVEEKRRSVVSSAFQLPRSSQATESRSVVRPEARMIRIGTSYRGETVTGPKTVGGGDLTERVIHRDVATTRQSQDKRMVERRPAVALAEEASSARTVQSNRSSAARQGFKSFRDVVGSNRFPTSAYRLMKRPLASATRGGGGGGGASSSCTGTTRIVRLSSGPRADSRSVVPASKPVAMRQTSGGLDKTTKLAIGDREDVRRVVASLPASTRGSHTLKATDGSLRYGHRDREHGSSPIRVQKRPVVAWNRRVNYKQQVSKAGRF